jgi:hypothetical protein
MIVTSQSIIWNFSTDKRQTWGSVGIRQHHLECRPSRVMSSMNQITANLCVFVLIKSNLIWHTLVVQCWYSNKWLESEGVVYSDSINIYIHGSISVENSTRSFEKHVKLIFEFRISSSLCASRMIQLREMRRVPLIFQHRSRNESDRWWNQRSNTSLMYEKKNAWLIRVTVW